MQTHTPASAGELGFVIPLVKIDAEKRLVYGVAALEQPDRTKEILDYEWSKPNFQAWSKSFEDATGGLSKGNVRVMHTKTVAGALKEFSCDDVNKRFNVCAHIQDDNEWQKVLGGSYTGFSVGGKYGRTQQDGELKRYEAIPTEISLVDRPCIPGAQFVELVKADGLSERMLITPAAVVALPLSFGERIVAQSRQAQVESDTFAKRWAGRPLSFAERLDAQRGARTVEKGIGSTLMGLGARALASPAAGRVVNAGIKGASFLGRHASVMQHPAAQLGAAAGVGVLAHRAVTGHWLRQPGERSNPGTAAAAYVAGRHSGLRQGRAAAGVAQMGKAETSPSDAIVRAASHKDVGLTKSSGRYDEAKHRRDHGRFTSSVSLGTATGLAAGAALGNIPGMIVGTSLQDRKEKAVRRERGDSDIAATRRFEEIKSAAAKNLRGLQEAGLATPHDDFDAHNELMDALAFQHRHWADARDRMWERVNAIRKERLSGKYGKYGMVAGGAIGGLVGGIAAYRAHEREVQRRADAKAARAAKKGS